MHGFAVGAVVVSLVAGLETVAFFAAVAFAVVPVVRLVEAGLVG